ncbi:hypothetical protein N8199_07615 [Emcibacteraceae bacterium]|nr:hypothetical protein [Emcibacteraceae bacterium]
MKKILLSFTIIFSTMFTSVSFAEWTKVFKNGSGVEFFVDFDTIRYNDEFVYSWQLVNYLEPLEKERIDFWNVPFDPLSWKTYYKYDCKSFGLQDLSHTFYQLPYGEGVGITIPINSKNWDYPQPGSRHINIMKSICK